MFFLPNFLWLVLNAICVEKGWYSFTLYQPCLNGYKYLFLHLSSEIKKVNSSIDITTGIGIDIELIFSNIIDLTALTL